MASNYDKQVDIGKSYFLKYDQEKLAVKFHLEMDERYLYLTYIGTPCRIERATGTVYEKNGEAYTECRSYETVMTIYDMLCHSLEPEASSPRWEMDAGGEFRSSRRKPQRGYFLTEIRRLFFRKSGRIKTILHPPGRSDKAQAGRRGRDGRDPRIFIFPGFDSILGRRR